MILNDQTWIFRSWNQKYEILWVSNFSPRAILVEDLWKWCFGQSRGETSHNPGDMAGCLARYFPGGGGCGQNVGYAAGANRQKATWQRFGLQGGPTLAAVFPRTRVFYIIIYVNLLSMGSLKLARWISFATSAWLPNNLYLEEDPCTKACMFDILASESSRSVLWEIFVGLVLW